MKKYFSFFSFFLLFSGGAFTQTNDVLKVTQFTLDNGLTVYLNEDHTAPQVYGGVVVNAGSKHESKEATGIAHYLEHVMFKGTDKIGTLNWEAEKPILDSITQMYDLLPLTQDVAQRKEIQKTINELSLRAAEFAIPNEVDLILQNIGGTGINAFTTEEFTAYYNQMPAHQLEKWMDVYVERFRNPIFRLFQSELETVYEEKNMYADNFYMGMLNEYARKFCKVHPYGQQDAYTIIGITEHLKNPSLTKMKEFYNTYYVANNMALILVGDFDTEKIIPLIKEKFAVWQNKPVPQYPVYKEEPFHGREEVTMKLSPLPMGIIGFRTVPANHEDEIALEICGQMLSNFNTGLLDQLSNENKLLFAYAMKQTYTDLGAYHIMFMPTLTKKLADAENLILEQLKKLKTGDFSDQLFEGVKLNYLKEHLQDLENLQMRGYTLIECFALNKSWEEELATADKVNQLTKEELIRVANLYFGDNYLMFNSKIGYPKKDKIEKPDWKPVVAKNNNQKSEFAQKIENLPEIETTPKFVDFKNDLTMGKLCAGVDYYQTYNPMNKVFTLKFRFNIGTETNNMYNYVAEYLCEAGTTTHKATDFKTALQNLGADIFFECDKNYFKISITGFDDKLEETLPLIAELFENPEINQKIIEKLYENEKSDYKFIVNDPETLGDALIEYIQYGQKSSFLDKLNSSEIKKLQANELITLFKEALTYESELHYIGTLPAQEVQSMLLKNIKFAPQPKKGPYIEMPVAEITKPKVYIHNNKKSLQSNMYILSNGVVADEKDKALLRAFNEYFGIGMSSIVFQEIREFRSLGYSTYAAYVNPILKSNKGFLIGYLGTQSDKTVEGVSALVNLVKNMPQKPERIDIIKRSLLQSVNTDNTTFRNLSGKVSQWKLQGYTDDPRKFQYQIFENLTFDEILATYQKFVQEKPIVITISGNLKKINLKTLSQFGEIVKVKTDEMIRR